MSSRAATLRMDKTSQDTWEAGPEQVFVGKDVLELLSSAMYLDPLTIYREYIQNAADAIDDAVSAGLITKAHGGKVEIFLSPDAQGVDARTIRIRDNGIGVSSAQFVDRLTALGGSQKRGTNSRGFRGVGRLAGLGYCQELVFRSKAAGEPKVSELQWDCRLLKALLRSTDSKDDLADVIQRSVKLRRVTGEKPQDHFFEVELRGVIRHKDDRLLNPTAVSDYLAQVAPVPFAPDFKYGAEISTKVRQFVTGNDVDIRINGSEPVYRPHRNRLQLSNGKSDPFTHVDYLEIPSIDGGVGAFAWILHHGYQGSIPAAALVKGLRFRCGNIQVGDNDILQDLFAEPRFNGWAVGVVHVLDSRVLPNGRRDHFEQTNHFNNLVGQLAPLAHDVTRKCRLFSLKRRLQRDFDLLAERINERFVALRRGGLSAGVRQRLTREAAAALANMEKIAAKEQHTPAVRTRMEATIADFIAKLKRRGAQLAGDSPLAKLPLAKRKMFEQMFSLIYEHAANKTVANALITRILERAV